MNTFDIVSHRIVVSNYEPVLTGVIKFNLPLFGTEELKMIAGRNELACVLGTELLNTIQTIHKIGE